MNSKQQQVSELFCSERSSLRRFLKRKLNDSADVDDLVQESYLRLYDARRRTRIGNTRGFLYRIASNLVIDRYRSREHNVKSLSIDSTEVSCSALMSDVPTPEQCAATDQQLCVLSKVIESLPPRCRQVFVSHRISQLTHREIACEMGISTQMVEKHIAKAVRVCTERMGPYR